MSVNDVEQQRLINEYRLSQGLVYVLTDEAVLELIKRDIESGKIPAGFAVLAQDAAVQKKLQKLVCLNRISLVVTMAWR